MQTIERKSLLYRSKVYGADFCLNHVLGCSHCCKYPCYAYLMKKRSGVIKNYEEWCQPKIVSNALELLDKEIIKYKNKIEYVHLCFSTDPFMYKQNEICDLSLKIINKLNSNNIHCSILTKGILPKELANENIFKRDNEFGITLVSLDENFKKNFEQNSANFDDRINSLKYLHDKGFKTWVCMEPYPTPNLIKQDLIKILDAISFVDEIYFGRWNYNSIVSEFKYSSEFYSSIVMLISKFCRKNKIDYFADT